MQYAQASDGARLAWTSEGAGYPLLLISGQATGAAGWAPIVPELAKTFRVIRFDPRGVGQSTVGAEDRYSTRSFADDARTVLNDAGVDRAHVYGHSMGGRTAQWLAIDHPDKVQTLILAATSPGGPLGVRRGADETAALISGDPGRLLPLFFDSQWAENHPDAVHDFFATPAPPRTKALHYRASRDHDARQHLSSIRAPTLILHGTDDLLTPWENAVALYQAIPHATLAKVPHGKHGFHLDHPPVISWIRRFIEHKTAIM